MHNGHVIVFNEGYAASRSETLTRPAVCVEAIRLSRLLVDLLPNEPEPKGLLALMFLNHSRWRARTDGQGDLLVLDEQDRSLWDPALIAEGTQVLESAARAGQPGPYQMQAAIAALHAEAPRPEQVDWPQIAALYERLYAMLPTAIVALNLAVAIGMARGLEAGLQRIEAVERPGRIDGYHYLHSARADLLRRAGQSALAAHSYERALALCTNPVESRYLQRRLDEVTHCLPREDEA